MEAVAEQELSVVLSSHLVSDVERACDYLVVLVDSRVQVAGDIEHLLATHHRLTGPRRDPETPARRPAGHHGEPHRPAVDLPRPHRRADPRPGLGGQRAHPRGPRPRLHAPAVDGRDAATRAGGPPMIWLTWRQFRASALVVLCAVAAARRGPRRHRPAARRPLGEAAGGLLRPARASIASRRRSSTLGTWLVYAAAAVVGVFWGAPMVARELEAGTSPAGLDPEHHPHPLAGHQARRRRRRRR